MRNNIGFYIGFGLFAIQTIAGELYRDYKMKQHNNRMLYITATTTTTTKETKD